MTYTTSQRTLQVNSTATLMHIRYNGRFCAVVLKLFAEEGP